MRVGPPGNRGAHHRSWFARIGALTVHVQYGDRGLLGNERSDSPREGWDAQPLREEWTRVDGSKEKRLRGSASRTSSGVRAREGQGGAECRREGARANRLAGVATRTRWLATGVTGVRETFVEQGCCLTVACGVRSTLHAGGSRVHETRASEVGSRITWRDGWLPGDARGTGLALPRVELRETGS